MTIYTINPDTWTKIGDGDCVVISEYRTELVYFRLDNGESVTSYLGKQLLIKNTGDLFAKSHSRVIEVKSTVADAAVRKNAADIITTNTALTANTDKDLETKNALESKDVDQDAIITTNKSDADAKNLATNARIDETNTTVAQNKTDQAGIDSAQDSIIDSNTQAITNNKTELDAKDVLIEQSIADNALADSNLSTVVTGIDTRLTDLELNPVKNINTSLPLSFWIGTQAELDLVLDRDANTVYMVKE